MNVVATIFSEAFEDAIDGVETITSIEQLEVYVRKLLQPYGLENAVYHAVKVPGQERLNPVLVLTYPAEWVRHYVAEDYFQIDPVVLRARNAVLPVDWDTLDRSPIRVRKLFGEARDAGVGRRGVTFPVRGPSGDSALFSITSNISEREWAQLKRSYMRDFQLIANFVHTRVMDLLNVDVDPVPIEISARQRECLQWASHGKTNDEIGAILGISERVVRFHMEGCRHKLGSVNRTQAVARAAALRLISI
jgi:DNA-binding CsgD family transcriptional regulator